MPRSILTLICTLVLGLAALATAPAAEDIRYPGHVQTETQKEAWRIGWPQLHGPFCNGTTIDGGYQLISKISDMRKVWESEAYVPPSSHHGIRPGFASPVVANGRVYVYFTWPSGLSTNPAEVSKEQAKALDTGRRDRTDRSDKPGDDHVLCIDALTGKTIWHRVFEGQGDTLLGSGKGGGHGTMCVKDGRAYAFGMAGWIYCLDAVSGETLWAEHKHPDAHSPNATPFVAENVLVYRHGQTLFGYRVDTGEQIWS
ncbi:MAG: PQQ-binding-like beta-propeller repeat protein, partial [Rhodosalinus sp.]